MNRRGFLKGLAAMVGGVALEEAIPLGRVWSFPKEIQRVKIGSVINIRKPQRYYANRFLTIAEVEALSKEIYLTALRDMVDIRSMICDHRELYLFGDI